MKNNFFKLPETQQRLALQQTSVQKNLPVQAVEKDLWVTSILQILFSIPCSSYFVFKGGTSLSKVKIKLFRSLFEWLAIAGILISDGDGVSGEWSPLF